MARMARSTSEIHTYLVVLKTQDIMLDDADKTMLLDVVQHYVWQMNSKIFAYHLADTCFRFVVQSDQMSELMKSICIRFVYSYNKQHHRKGEIFKDRFTSYSAHTVAEVYQMIASLHYLQEETKFCSKYHYNEDGYLQDKTGRPYLVMTPSIEQSLFLQAQQPEVLQLMRKIGKKYTEVELAQLVKAFLDSQAETIQSMNVEKKKKLIQRMVSLYGASIRQIVKITGFSFRFVYQTMKKVEMGNV